MPNPMDVGVRQPVLWFLPVTLRVPLKFGDETIESIVSARVRLRAERRDRAAAEGWGETPLSAAWAWPAALPFSEREEAMKSFCRRLADAVAQTAGAGHPIELSYAFMQTELPRLLAAFNQGERADREPMPWLAALICYSPYDIALHDAYGKVNQRRAYDTYAADCMNADLSAYLTPAEGANVSFDGLYPAAFLRPDPAATVPVWHLVGGKDPLDATELTGREPDDGHPLLLADWIKRDGLRCLKIKLTGSDAAWDFERLAKTGRIALANGVDWLSADFNCTVADPEYVNEILDRLMREQPRVYAIILYVEQPFPYDLEATRIDVRSVAARKPLFMDESAHDWQAVRLGRELGWTGVALKTCKTQTGALLTLCWASAHGMTLMVQDLTNSMLAQVPHALLGAHANTIMGVESNAMQFCPDASRPESLVHPGLYSRRYGVLDLSTLEGPGFGYRLEEISRTLGPPAVG